MAESMVKFFRDPQEAQRAVGELKKKGYKAEEIGLLMRHDDQGEASAKDIGKPIIRDVLLPNVGPIIATGPMATALSGAGANATGTDLEATLAGLWGLTDETIKYYEFGLSAGGVVVSVHTEEARARQAREILRAAEAIPKRPAAWANSPGFAIAGRMTATDPVDAPMSGDFRKY